MTASNASARQDLDQLVTLLLKAADEATTGNQQAVEEALQTIERLKELKVSSESSCKGCLSTLRQPGSNDSVDSLSRQPIAQVDTQLLVETQCGKKARKLTKHADMNIKGAAAELINLWKEVVASEAAAIEKTKEQLGTPSASSNAPINTEFKLLLKLDSRQS